MKRYCLFNKHKLNDHLPTVPNTALTIAAPFTSKTSQTTFDCRMLRCFNDKCSSSQNGDAPKQNEFHFCCYFAMFCRQSSSDKQYDHLIVDKTNVSRVFSPTSIERVAVDSALESHGNILLPICSKRCYNSVKHHTNIDGKDLTPKKKKLSESKSNWDNDGGPNSRSSEKVLVDWLCDENNNRLYFGGTHTNGKTSGKTKKAYHKIIQDLIYKENGRIYTLIFPFTNCYQCICNIF